METSQTLTEIAKALVSLRLSAVPKLGFNPAYKSQYMTLDDILAAIDEPLKAAGLAVVQMPEQAGVGEVGLTTMLLHTSGEFIKSFVSAKISDGRVPAQEAGKASTYLRRYAIAGLLGIASEPDTDAEGTGPQANRKPPQPKTKNVSAGGSPSPAPQQKSKAPEEFFGMAIPDPTTPMDFTQRQIWLQNNGLCENGFQAKAAIEKLQAAELDAATFARRMTVYYKHRAQGHDSDEAAQLTLAGKLPAKTA